MNTVDFEVHQKDPSRFGDAPTVEKMRKCVWIRSEAVAQIEFLEWTSADRLRHATFVGPRYDDKDPQTAAEKRTAE